LSGAGFFTRDGRYSPEFISNYLDVYVKDAIKRVPGVGCGDFGERKYAMRVWLDPIKLASRALTATDVINALVEQNVEIPRDNWDSRHRQGPVLSDSGARGGRLSSPEEFDNIILKSSRMAGAAEGRGRSVVGAEDYS